MANQAGEHVYHKSLKLVHACCDENIATVHQLLKEGADPKNVEKRIPQEVKVSPLHYAAYHGWVDIVELFIGKYKCDPMIRDDTLDCPLHYACKGWQANVAKLLLEKYKCNPNCQNTFGQTPVQQVISPKFEGTEVIKVLVQNNANLNLVDYDGNTPLHKACEYTNSECVGYLLKERKCDPNIKNNAGLTPLQVIDPSLYYNKYCTECFKELLKHGANGNVVDRCGNTPLHKACEHGNLDCVKCCLEDGKCDPNIKNNDGLTPIQVTNPRRMFTEITKGLVQHGANTNVVDKHGNTPLHKVCESGNLEIVRCLLEDGKCDPSIKNNAGLTPIQMTPPSSPMLVDIVVMLYRHGAKPYIVIIDHDGNTLLYRACKSGSLENVKYLLEVRKCDPNIKNNEGLTPLQVVASSMPVHYVEICEELFLYGANPNAVDNDGNTPLHKACKHGNLDIVKYLLKDGKCDPNIKNNAGLTPILVTNPWRMFTEITKRLVMHGANTNVVDKHGNTPLHKACESGNLEIVRCLLEKGKCDPNIKNNAGLTPLGVTSLEFPDIDRELVRHGATFIKAYKKFGNVLRNPQPLQTPVKVFIVGNPSTGKSTLTKSLKSELRLFGRFVKVSGVDEKTAGIIPHGFTSKKYGCVVLYDFAGQRSYYSSHAAVLRSTIQSSPPIFIIVVSLLENKEDILADLMFWLSFLNNQNFSIENKPHVIIVGSHADKLKSRRERVEHKIARVIESLPPVSDFVLVEAIPLDCRYPNSDGMSKLHLSLKQSCDTLRLAATINFNAHCFFVFLLEKFKSSTAVALKEIQGEISQFFSSFNDKSSPALKDALMGFIPSTLESLCAICDDLNDRGHILFLKDHSNVENSWVILDKSALLSEVTGTVFAPADFKQHCTLASSTGVVPLSNLSRHFPKHNIEMLVAFLYHLEFCREVTDPEARSLIIEHHQSGANKTEYSDTELYFLFPGLIRLEAPEDIWKTSIQFLHYFGWKLQTKSPQFFTTRLLQVLILRLAFSFALAPDPKDIRSDVPAFQRKCSIWKNGIFWGDRSGVETLVEMISSNDAIILLMRCRDSNLASLLLLRSKLVQKILGVARELCSRVETDELFVDSSQCTQYRLASATCFSVQEIAKSVLERVPNPAVVSSDGRSFPLESLLIYEPFTGPISTKLFSDSLDSRISDHILLEIAEHISHSHGHKIVTKVVKENTTLHTEDVTRVANVSDELFVVLKTWRDKCEGTYQKLRDILEQLSIFAARNPVILAGASVPEKQESDQKPAGVNALENQVSDQGIEPQLSTMKQDSTPSDRKSLTLAWVSEPDKQELGQGIELQPDALNQNPIPSDGTSLMLAGVGAPEKKESDQGIEPQPDALNQTTDPTPSVRTSLTLARVIAPENQELDQGIEPRPDELNQSPTLSNGTSLDHMNITTALTNLLQWHELGRKLDIKKVKLDEIILDYEKYGQSRQKSEMIDLWLRTDKDASWEKLCAALEILGEFTIADKIKKQYIAGPPPSDGTSLDHESVATALDDLLQWHELGQKLDIKQIKLDEIKLDYDKFGQSRQKSEMIDFWLRTDRDSSWEKLCAALELMGEFTIADKIRTKYTSDSKIHADHEAMKSQPESTNSKNDVDQLEEETQRPQVHVQESVETVRDKDCDS